MRTYLIIATILTVWIVILNGFGAMQVEPPHHHEMYGPFLPTQLCAVEDKNSTRAHIEVTVSEAVTFHDTDMPTFTSADTLPDGEAAYRAWQAQGIDPAAGTP